MRGSLIFAALAIGAVWACSGKATYPRCSKDGDCAIAGKHDYCVTGACVYCRTATDCGDREMCRAGACSPDPDLQLKDGGDDAETDAEPEASDEPLETPRRRRVLRIEE